MKCITNLFICLFFSTYLFGQHSIDPSEPIDYWEDGLFKQETFFKNRIKAIHIKTIGNTPTRGGGSHSLQSGKSFFYDSKGRLLKMIETDAGDTSMINTYAYTQHGKLCFKETKDKIWKKRYKTGYRFNRDASIFQIKYYEMINDQNTMLLDTRHFVYQPEENRQEIRYLEENRIIKRLIRSINNDAVVEKMMEEESGDLIQERNIMLNEDGNWKKISIQKGQHLEEYLYSYDENNRLSEISLFENGKLREKAVYLYSPNGLLDKMYRDIISSSNQQELAAGYEYEFFE